MSGQKTQLRPQKVAFLWMSGQKTQLRPQKGAFLWMKCRRGQKEMESPGGPSR